MPVILARSAQAGQAGAFDQWCATAGATAGADEAAALDPARRVPGLGGLLEAAFDAIRDPWWDLGRRLFATPSAGLAHMPTASTYSSDFGVMAAWTHLAGDLARAPETTLMLCDDPWLFRQLAETPGIRVVGSPPPLAGRRLRLALRGLAARAAVSVRLVKAWWRCRAQRAAHAPGARVLLVYGHPSSRPDGYDAYFGALMTHQPDLVRLLHTDCPADRAGFLAGDGRSAALHGWGRPWWVLDLPFARWRPSSRDLDHPWRWLIRRAADHEGGKGSAAMTRWQMRCQRAWLDAVRPRVVAWPWENHPWERDFVRAARRAGTWLVGWEHAVVGPHMYNQSPATNPDGLDSLPHVIACNGPAYRDDLARWGIPRDRLPVAGAIRQAPPQDLPHDPDGPIFVALSSDHGFNDQIMAALAPVAARGGRVFLVKDHPMFPYAFAETPWLRRTEKQLQHQGQGLAAVLYSTGTVGLEAMLGGLPTLRFRPAGYVAMNVLPSGVAPVAVDPDTLGPALDCLPPRPRADWHSVFSPVDWQAWGRILTPRAGGERALHEEAGSV